MMLPVHITAVANLDDGHYPCCVVDFIDDPIVACSDSPCSLGAFQLLTAGRSRVIRQGFQLLFDHLKGGRGNGFQFSSCSAGNGYAVTHLRLRRISVSACSKGMGVSPEAFAFSYSRTACKSSISSRSSSYSSMLNTTATFSPRLFKTNRGSFAMDASPNVSYCKPKGRAVVHLRKERLNQSLS